MDKMLLGIAGTSILLLLAIIGYFLTNLHSRFEKHVEDSEKDRRHFEELKGDVKVLTSEMGNLKEWTRSLDQKIEHLPQRIIDLHKATSKKEA